MRTPCSLRRHETPTAACRIRSRTPNRTSRPDHGHQQQRSIWLESGPNETNDERKLAVRTGIDFAGDHADAPFGDTPADAGDCFVVGGMAVQHARGQIAAERHSGKTEVRDQFHHRGAISWSVSRSSWPGIWSLAPVRAA